MWFIPLPLAGVQPLLAAVPGGESGRGSAGLAGAEGRGSAHGQAGGKEEGGGGNQKTRHPVSCDPTALHVCQLMLPHTQTHKHTHTHTHTYTVPPPSKSTAM